MHLSPRRGLPALAALVLLSLPLAACGRTTVSGVGAQMTSAPREEAAGSGDGGDLEQPSDGTAPEDGLGDLPVPDLAMADDCVAVLEAYAGLAASAIGGPDAAAEARAVAEELKADLPEDLHDDLDVVADAYTGIADDGFLEGAGALTDPAFGEANQNISDYLQETCVGG